MPVREAYSSEQAAELNRLLNALPVAIRLASGLLRETSMLHPSYIAADAEVSKLVARVNELINTKTADHGQS